MDRKLRKKVADVNAKYQETSAIVTSMEEAIKALQVQVFKLDGDVECIIDQ